MKKLLSIILSALMLLSVIPAVISAANMPFRDVDPSAWYYDEVETVYEAGIMEGKTGTSFDPSANMSRAEFVTVLCRLSGEDYKGKGEDLTFTDTLTDAWYADYVAWGVEAEMVKGLPGNKFAPDQAVSRQEMAVFIDRFTSYMHVHLKMMSAGKNFKDSSKIAEYAKASVDVMRRSGIITGDENGRFNPSNNASRAEVAAVVKRIIPLLDSTENTSPDVDRENFDVQMAFDYSDARWDGLPYRIYFPEGYSEDKEYPVTYFIGSNDGNGTDNKKQLDDASIMFLNAGSPIFDSIVVVPQAPVTWNNAMPSKLSDLLDHINEKYNVASDRTYMIGARGGVWASWKMLLLRPESISAVLFVHGVGPTAYGHEGVIDEFIDDIPDELKDIPIHFLHDTDDGVKFEWRMGPTYGRDISNALVELEGFTNVYLTERTGYGENVYKHFVTEDDVSLLDWLFAQRRETK